LLKSEQRKEIVTLLATPSTMTIVTRSNI